jgi:hypothetical protein
VLPPMHLERGGPRAAIDAAPHRLQARFDVGGKVSSVIARRLARSGQAAAWARTKCVSRPTGRPVAPLAAPDFQAVPAMSRCAHGYLPV